MVYLKPFSHLSSQVAVTVKVVAIPSSWILERGNLGVSFVLEAISFWGYLLPRHTLGCSACPRPPPPPRAQAWHVFLDPFGK